MMNIMSRMIHPSAWGYYVEFYLVLPDGTEIEICREHRQSATIVGRMEGLRDTLNLITGLVFTHGEVK